ncbi:MAG TPA: helix-turn-helix domain-containing protein, partial [Kofleriaceae bacterium]|nr:helix-turn-helix domain-containing protein [Kofleriaceae bacterium]
PLARAFLAAACGDPRRVPAIDPAALDLLTRYAWPGNIRELRNVVERAALLCEHGAIGVEHLPVDKMRATYTAPRDAGPGAGDPAAAALDDDDDRGARPSPTRALEALYPGEPERDRIIATLELCRGNQTRAASILGMSRRTLLYRLERYGLPRPRKRG